MKWIFVFSVLFFGALEVHASHKTNIHASIREVPIKENGEELVDLRSQSIIIYRFKSLLKNPVCTQIRKSVYEKLCRAQKLLPQGLRFEVSIGLRSLKVQKHLFDNMHEEVRKKFPNFCEKELFMETSKFVAPVETWEGTPNVPPHSTGGAVDLVLIDEQGKYVDMGIDMEKELNNPFNKEIIQTDSTLISVEARKNRAIMAKALSSLGFVNYSAEFWHWSYGDRRWAFINNEEYSIYGPIAEEL
jgi:D-alanyl-D-alanine dipeptidase